MGHPSHRFRVNLPYTNVPNVFKHWKFLKISMVKLYGIGLYYWVLLND